MGGGVRGQTRFLAELEVRWQMAVVQDGLACEEIARS